MRFIKDLLSNCKETFEDDKPAFWLMLVCGILGIALIIFALYITNYVTQAISLSMQIDNFYAQAGIFCGILAILAVLPNFINKYQFPIFILISICILLGIIKPF
ncbi:hypothetical protein [Shewanella marina]|uniref:hypothetical protein n=1 Tax=Shewanella marina TaxID=487319 RepID=UPI00046F1C5F|nr:hypothetical protein [Shewanella marina]